MSLLPKLGSLRRRVGEALPLPPVEMRALVGPTERDAFDNPNAELIYPHLEPRLYERVLDFGCGCGRLARQLVQQRPQPREYLGIDLHRAMVDWCRNELAPRAAWLRFAHHDVFNAQLNPGAGKPRMLPFPARDGAFTLVIAHSVLTHVVEDAAGHYLREVARVLRPDGALNATFFLFDKSGFPMMQEFQNALYINEGDPTNAVIFDRTWLRGVAREAGLVITQAIPPAIRGFHWTIVMRPLESEVPEIELPEDTAPLGRCPPPVLSR